ncbi:hypothetical protein Tco_0167868, partial [Tanacetum coccineum]
YGENLCSSHSSAFRLSYGSSIFFGEANQASKSVLRSGIAPIGLAASGNLFCIIAFSSFQSLVYESCPKSKKQVTPNPPEGGSKATSEGDWIKVQKKGKGKDPERISDGLEDPVSHAPLAFNSQGEHSEGKTALAFSTPTGISLGGSYEPLTLSPDHKPLGGCKYRAYGESTVFREPPYPFNYSTRRLTMEEMLAKFIDEEVKGVKTKGGKMTSEANHSKKINETGFNKNEPPIFEQDVQEKPHDDGMENKSSSIRERTTQPLNLKQLYINIPFIEALVQIPKYAKYLKSLLTNKSKLEEACMETINERCSSILLNEVPLKEKDPGSFTIPCQVLEKHKETKDLAADHSSRLENPHMKVLAEREIADEFSDDI